MNKATPLYIFDLDGTLACLKHRRHFVECERSEQDWKSFYAACDQDSPIAPVIGTMEELCLAGAEIWIFSGRAATERHLADMRAISTGLLRKSGVEL